VTRGTERGNQILIVDPDVSHRDEVGSFLRKEGYTVQTVADDQAALDLLRDGTPDLILLDPAFAAPLAALRRSHLALAGTPLVVPGAADTGGAEVDVTLPRPVPPEQLLAVVRRYVSRPKPVILVVEDDLSIQGMFQIALETAGFVVWQAASGPATIELFRQHGECVTLVLLDVQLIGPLDGPQTLVELRRLRPDFPFCFMSGHAGPYSSNELLALGASHIFPKPFPSLAEVMYLLWKLVPPPGNAE
jgi:DNA-binding response OmpR family regulator